MEPINNEKLDGGFVDHLFDGLSEEWPDDPWELLEGSGLSKSNHEDVIEAIEKEEDISSLMDGVPDVDVHHSFNLHRRDEHIEEMFDDDLERQLALLVKVRVHEACRPWETVATRRKAMRWIFCSIDDSMPENDYLSFRDALSPFQARTEVVQARVQFQLYRNSTPMREPLPWIADEPPSVIEGELLGSSAVPGGENAVTMFRTAWMWPGIRIDILKDQSEEFWREGVNGSVEDVFEALVDYGYFGVSNGFVYAICRNPELKGKGGTFSWSDAL